MTSTHGLVKRSNQYSPRCNDVLIWSQLRRAILKAMSGISLSLGNDRLVNLLRWRLIILFVMLGRGLVIVASYVSMPSDSGTVKISWLLWIMTPNRVASRRVQINSVCSSGSGGRCQQCGVAFCFYCTKEASRVTAVTRPGQTNGVRLYTPSSCYTHSSRLEHVTWAETGTDSRDFTLACCDLVDMSVEP